MRFTDFILAFIPPSLRQRAVDFKNSLWGGYRHQGHYSQFGEDALIDKLLKKKKGIYVDVGANHPFRYSNTALLHERGWRGINIEPNPEAFPLFKKARPDDITLSVGISSEVGMLPYYRFSDPAFNTFSPDEAAKLRGRRWLAELTPLEIPVVTLASILREHVPEDHIDFLNIDAEGHDLSVLESNDWKHFCPDVIAVEAHNFDKQEPEKNKIYSFLSDKNYHFITRVGHTLIFQNASAVAAQADLKRQN